IEAMRTVGCAVVAAMAIAPALVAQSAGPAPQAAEFEVASIKRHPPDDPRIMMVARPGGRFTAVNIPLRMLIRTAYQIQDDQIVGGPSWVASDGFDIDATANESGPPGPQFLLRLQTLLAQRFSLVVHRETKDLPIYAVVRARRDGTLGPGLRPTACPAIEEDLSRPQPCANISTGNGRLTLRGMPLAQFLPFLAPQVNRVLVDRTGLAERYDIELTWTPELQPRGLPAGPDAAPVDPNALSIFTAMQEQLGLKLDATRGPVEVVVIDGVEPPTPN
ncbi:MAG TPA: TIGR03435 family protein, partial [Vicinamibacterales bacterium]